MNLVEVFALLTFIPQPCESDQVTPSSTRKTIGASMQNGIILLQHFHL